MSDLFLFSLERQYIALIDHRDALKRFRRADRAALQRQIDQIARQMLEIETGRAA